MPPMVATRRHWLWWAGASISVLAAVAIGFAALTAGADEEDASAQALTRPGAGNARAEYLADGEPVWVVGHDDGSVSIVSAFDTHEPFGIGKLNWWCPPARGFVNPHHGSKWDEFGVHLDGPAPRGLTTWSASVVSNRVWPGEAREGEVPETPHAGADNREWCTAGAGAPRWHTFPGWKLWTSPTDAAAAATDEWILLEGRLVRDADGSMRLCAVTGCDDAVVPDGVETIPDEWLPEGGEVGHFLARVRDGRLTELTRVAGPPTGTR